MFSVALYFYVLLNVRDKNPIYGITKLNTGVCLTIVKVPTANDELVSKEKLAQCIAFIGTKTISYYIMNITRENLHVLSKIRETVEVFYLDM